MAQRSWKSQVQRRHRTRTEPALIKRARRVLKNQINLAQRRWTEAGSLKQVLKQDPLESREISGNERGQSQSISNLQTTPLLVSKTISAEAATAKCEVRRGGPGLRPCLFQTPAGLKSPSHSQPSQSLRQEKEASHK